MLRCRALLPAAAVDVPRTTRLPPTHALLALAVVAVWGTNFVVMRIALDVLPPLLLALLRFALALVPALLFVPRPRVGWRTLAAYGVAIALAIRLIFVAMNGRISPGASLVCNAVCVTIGWRWSSTAAGARLQGRRWRWPLRIVVIA